LGVQLSGFRSANPELSAFLEEILNTKQRFRFGISLAGAILEKFIRKGD
jgi:hypothetical protein